MSDHLKPYLVITSIGGSCPCQADGTMYGFPFYLRARHGEWTMTVVRPGEDPVLASRAVVHVSGDDPEEGYMTIPQAMTIIGRVHEKFWEKAWKHILRGDPLPEDERLN